MYIIYYGKTQITLIYEYNDNWLVPCEYGLILACFRCSTSSANVTRFLLSLELMIEGVKSWVLPSLGLMVKSSQGFCLFGGDSP